MLVDEPSGGNWQVMSWKFIHADMNYEVIVQPCMKFKNRKSDKIIDRIKIIRLPYKPTVGQVIKCPSLH